MQAKIPQHRTINNKEPNDVMNIIVMMKIFKHYDGDDEDNHDDEDHDDDDEDKIRKKTQ